MADRGIPKVIVLLVMSLVTAVYICALTIVNVALPQMQGALAATPDQISWVITLNLVATAVATPLTGWLVAKWGQRNTLIWCIVGFTATTYMCAITSSLEPLLLYRIGQGAFGAPLVPIAQAVILNTYKEPDKRAIAMSIWGMSVVIGPGLAPALGGYMSEEYSWRWTFYLLLPVCLAALLGVIAFIKDVERTGHSKLDWVGFMTLSLAVSCLQIILDRGERLDWFESKFIILLGVILVLSCYFFLVHSFFHKNPFINPYLFTDRNYAIGLIFVFVYGMLNVTTTVLLPTMLQDYVGYPDSDIGFILAMRSVGIFLGFLVAPRITKTDPRYSMGLGLVAIGLSGLISAGFNANITVSFVSWVGILQGIGCGLLWVPLSVVTFSTLRENLMADGTAFFHLIRNYGSSIFIALNVMVVLRTSKVNHSELSEIANSYNELLARPGVEEFMNLDTPNGLISLAQEIGNQAVMIGYLNSFILYALGALIPIPLLLIIRRNKAATRER
ncbi:MAG: DHA2 family efflux MFS transporter permease subunit [Pseudomonadota bacterium]|nr:DHA2 family efflux MFS transporter permease subunit [Pseudomonadota bacterium]